MKITEDYVSFETSKLLKENGINPLECGVYYSTTTGKRTTEPLTSLIACPTHQRACKWLREVHNIHIIVFRYDNSAFPYIWYIFGHNKEKPQKANSYEEAVEAALKYVLENLI